MSYVHNNQRRYAIGRLKQSDYGTPTATNLSAPFNFEQMLLKDTPGQNFANYAVRVQNNQGYSTGSDFATEQWLTAHDVDRQGLDFDVCSETVGRLLYYALGSVATTTPTTGVYNHVFTPQNPNSVGRQLPAFTYVEQIGAEHDVLYPSCVLDTLSISGDSLNRIMGSGTFRGSGKRTSPSNVNFTTQVGQPQNLHYFYNTQVYIEFDPITTGTQLAYSCDYDNFSLVIRNGLNPEGGYRAGCGKYQVDNDSSSGAVRSEMLFGQRDVDMTLTVRLNQASKEYEYLQTQKLLTGVIQMDGTTITGFHKHRLSIAFDQVAVETVVIGTEVDNIVTLQLSLQPLVTAANPSRAVSVSLTNTVPSYLS